MRVSSAWDGMGSRVTSYEIRTITHATYHSPCQLDTITVLPATGVWQVALVVT